MGTISLVLPGPSRIRTGLTWLTAAGLVVVMGGAAVLTRVGVTPALGPLVLGPLAGFAAYYDRRRGPVAPPPVRMLLPPRARVGASPDGC